ncbi:MAG: ABC transporter permease [Deltaproteobacteria bacterium]|nr:ABC transporter permease [Deltaproteobacteria bacterium]
MKNNSVDERFGGRNDGVAGFIKSNKVTVAVYIVTILLYVVTLFVSPSFRNWHHLMLVLVLASFLIVVSYGQGIVILVRGLDLSVGSMITLSGVLVAAWVSQSNENILWAIPLVLLITTFIGMLNGIGATLLRIPPFVMTLSTGIIVFSVVLGFTEGSPHKGNAPRFLNGMMLDHTAGIPNIVYFLILFIFVAVIVQSYSAFGRKLYALGANPKAAHISGLRNNLLTISAFGISGFCCGLVGMMLVGYTDAPTLTMGDPYVMSSIAAVVVGGSSILGGKGNYLGTVGGVLLLTILSTLITAIGLAEGWRTIIQGAIIVMALIMSSVSERNTKIASAQKNISKSVPETQKV